MRDLGPLPLTVVVPIRHGAADADLAQHLGRLARWADQVVLVDGSEKTVRGAYARLLDPAIEHVVVDEDRRGLLNGKVAGVLTGVGRARHARVVIADDDVRHTRSTLARLARLIDDADVVRPQNHFVAAEWEALPWHARWDTGRTLLNRALGADWPGTLGVDRDLLVAAGGYSGDVLFENRELVRTMEAVGGRVLDAPDLFVARVPPTTHHFWGQRVRQAYDSLAQPGRLLLELSILPCMVALPASIPVLLCAAVVLAECGRRRSGGRTVFPPSASLWAAAWLVERAVCVWLAVLTRATGSVRYAGGSIRRAGSSRSAIRRRVGGITAVATAA